MRSLILAAVAAFAFASVSFASSGGDRPMETFRLDAAGRCHDTHGHFAVASKCVTGEHKTAPHCDKGKLCGDTCIPKDKVCHKGRTVRDPT